MTRDEIISEIARLEPWFHCIDLFDGIKTKAKSAIGEPTEHPRPTWEKVKDGVPGDLSGKSVLDVGCNAGFYAIEMKRRGATRVVGIDSQQELVRQANFVRHILGLDIDYRRMSVYDLDPRELGQFDLTLALGLIYHCKHLVLALEKLFLITRQTLILETAIYPPDKTPPSFVHPVGGTEPTLHPIAYIENQPDAKEAVYNWFLPSTAALCALLQNIGFNEVELLPGTQTDRAVLVCRKHEPYPDSRAISYLGSRLELLSAPSRCHPGEVLRFKLRAENTGNSRWLRGSESGREKGDVHLVAHLLDADAMPVSWYHAGAFLPHDVAPGDTVEIEIALNAPDTSGNFILQFDMVSEHLAWFEDLGSEVVRHSLTVD